MLVYDKVRHGLGLHRRFYQIHKMGVKVDLHLLLFKVYQTLVKRNKTINAFLDMWLSSAFDGTRSTNQVQI